MRRALHATLLALPLLLASPALAYYHYVHFLNGAPYQPVFEKFDLGALMENTVTVRVTDASPKTAGNDSFASVLSQVKAAAAVWNSVSASSLRVAFAGLQAQNQTSGNTPDIEVEFAQLPPGILAEAAPTVAVGAVQRGSGTPFFPISGSVVFLNSTTSVAPGPSYAETYFTTTVHELGHALGLQHTFTGSAMSQQVVRNTTRTYPLDADDIASLAMLYGAAGWNANYGSISGQILMNNAGVALASVVALPVTGQPVSTLTNPDGTFEIDGLSPGQYLLYTHPLPPDADVTLPQDANGKDIAASGPFGTVFYSSGYAMGTLDPAGATSLTVAAGAPVTGTGIQVSPRAAVPIYDVVTFSYFDPIGQTYTYNAPSIAVTPAFVNSVQRITAGIATVTIQSANGTTPVPTLATLLGGFGNTVLTPQVCCTPSAVALYFHTPVNPVTGPMHLVLNFGNDIYVLPDAVVSADNNPPTVTSVTANTDGTATIAGTNLTASSRVFFDSVEAAITKPFSGTLDSGTITVAPPPGFGGQKASVVVYNSDWQSSITLDSTALAYGTTLPDPPPTYNYPAAAAPSITAVPAALPGGAAGRVDITATNMNFVDGQVTVGLGTSDAQVRDIFVLSPTHVVANVVTSGNPLAGTSEISVMSGLQTASLTNAFQVQPAPSAPLPYITSVANGIAGNATIFGYGYATIKGANLGMALGTVQATLNGEPALIVYATEDQINIMLPGDIPAGLMNLVVNNGLASSPPLAVETDVAPPVIVGLAPDGAPTAVVGGLLDVQVAGLNQAVLADQSRLAVTLGGVAMPIVQITPNGGMYTIQVQLTKSPAGPAVPVAVSVDGSSWAPIPVSVSPAP